MTDPKPTATRRHFLADAGKVAAASAFAGLAMPSVHAAEDHTIRLALVGCGGRGTGAAGDALSVQNGPIRLVAMADAFSDRLSHSVDALNADFSDRIDVPADRRFLGFDAYRKV